LGTQTAAESESESITLEINDVPPPEEFTRLTTGPSLKVKGLPQEMVCAVDIEGLLARRQRR
jgi:hypothetical protein